MSKYLIDGLVIVIDAKDKRIVELEENLVRSKEDQIIAWTLYNELWRKHENLKRQLKQK